MKVIFEKHSSFAKMKSYLDTHLRVVHVVLIAEEDMYFLGPFFSTSGHFRSKFDQPRTQAISKKWNYGLKNIKQFFDAHLRDIGVTTLRHYVAHFNQIRIFLVLILVNPE
jgi:hypothetical protein